MMIPDVSSTKLWTNLRPHLEYLPPSWQTRVQEALTLAHQAHAGQLRRSGEPYIIHPVAVAEILADLQMDADTLIAGLLHDTVEDTSLTFEDLEHHFGATVRRIVEGETKVSKLPKLAGQIEDEQAENLRQMFIAMTEDVRIIIVKLADRLHNMRTLEFMPPAKQQRIAQETLEIFAPLAHRLGIGQIKWRLEDLAFRHLYPEEYETLRARLELQGEVHQSVVQEAKKQLEETLHSDQGLKHLIKGYVVTGRSKHLHSIWRKMQRDDKGLEQIYDLLALRVVLEPRESKTEAEAKALEQQVCYHVLGLAHAFWQPIPGRVKDYIAMPKPNGYQSLHTTVITLQGIPLEVQIRTRAMHQVAEYGVAAHWLYKEGPSTPAEIHRRVGWLHVIQEWQKEFSTSRDFVEAVTTDLLSGRVFVFTPQGRVINLPRGATAIDFAYHIHTEVGHHMIGAKVGGRIVPLSYVLKNGDMLEIITSKSSTGPSKDWLNNATTRSARQKIRHFFREAERDEILAAGRKLLERHLRRRNLPIPKEAKLEGAAKQLTGNAFPEDLYLALAQSRVSAQQVTRALQLEPAAAPRVKPPKHRTAKSQMGVYLEGDLKAPIKLVSCCRPVRGDAILGYVTRGRGVSIHQADCPNMKRFLREEPERCLSAMWDAVGKSAYPAQLRLLADDRTGLLKDVGEAISQMGKSLSGINTTTSQNRAAMQLRLEVSGDEELERIRKTLLSVAGVLRVDRA